MAGHSQFSNIMHRKGAQDKKRAKIFAKHTREIMVAAKIGLPDPEGNPRLRAAMIAARSDNMPKDNIERAIKRATGGADGEVYEEIRYEGYGPGGVAVIVEALTDNRNRTASEVRSAFSKHGGNLGETGSVGFMFDRVGEFNYPADAATPDGMLDAAVEAGADDCISDDSGHVVICDPAAFSDVRDALEAALGEPERAALNWRPQNTIDVDADKATTILKLIDALEDNDDVQKAYANFDISEELMESLID